MKSAACTLVIVGISLVAGCGPHYSGAAKRTDGWPGSSDQLGRTAVLVANPPSQCVADELRESLSRDAHITVIDGGPILSGLQAGETLDALSDVTLLAAARKTDAQTVMLVSIADCNWSFGLLPPSAASGTIRYQIRVLDVQTGRMLLSMNRSCECTTLTIQDFVQRTPQLMSQDITRLSTSTRPAA